MKSRLSFALPLLILACSVAAHAEEAAVKTFTPQGEVKGIRQVRAEFSEQMVPFGEPRLEMPFEVNCPEKGTGRWADGKNWVYDFERDLPAGVRCEFTLKPDIRTISGEALGGQKLFAFSTGGPAVLHISPHKGADIAEDQAFVLTLDAEATEASIVQNVRCEVEGINERISVRVLTGKEWEEILKVQYSYDEYKDMPVVAVQCKQHFPNGSKVSLVWGKGVESSSGVSTATDQTFEFTTREPFTAKFSCIRENARADCIPLLPMEVYFSAPVEWSQASKIVLIGDKKSYKPRPPDDHPDLVYVVYFDGPFPEKSAFTIEFPPDLRDDAGRKLSNIDNATLAVSTDHYPPLAKFAARFGIIEKSDPVLPVTIRNIEIPVKGMMLDLPHEKGVGDKIKEGLLDAVDKVSAALDGTMAGKGKDMVETLKGKVRRADSEADIIQWLQKVAGASRDYSLLEDKHGVKKLSIPKASGRKTTEVVGIPLKKPGFYVVELESKLLGEALFGQSRPMYVQAAALVTNLSAHFKWGRERSLVWVTTLDKAEPVPDAAVSVRNCRGEKLWEGKTNKLGIAYVDKLPERDSVPYCDRLGRGEWDDTRSRPLDNVNGGLYVMAKTAGDMTFVHSDWDAGIEPWRFNLPRAHEKDRLSVRSIFDRPLFRAGETVHMKHVIRWRTMSGFTLPSDGEMPVGGVVRHKWTDQVYPFTLKWDTAKGIAETEWKVPPGARLGYYEVYLTSDQSMIDKKGGDKIEGIIYNRKMLYSGEFRVEEFRVPLMKGTIQLPSRPLINATGAEVDLQAAYLSGGGAGNLPVKLRSLVQQKTVEFRNYEDFTFANGEVKEGLVTRRGGKYGYYEYDGEGDDEGEDSQKNPAPANRKLLKAQDMKLGPGGAARASITDIPKAVYPQDVIVEMEFQDPNGERQTVSRIMPVWTSGVVLGIKPHSWTASKDSLHFQVATLDVSGKPVPGADVAVEVFSHSYYSHRKRLVGGFYAYEHAEETKKIGLLCEGKTDSRGLLICEVKPPASGRLILQARAVDESANESVVHQDVWVAGNDSPWWFDVSDNDRIDLLPEKKRYEPGETAKFQVRMPFREATALVTVEREGVMKSYVRKVSGKSPVVEVPIQGNYAPNAFVSVLCVRGRVGNVKLTAMVDLGKPAYKMGIAAIEVGWKAHELKVTVTPDREVYRVRGKALVKINVRHADGRPLQKKGEIALSAVDEGLLELMPNNSWQLLDGMMQKRGYEVRTATTQMQVVGKRHFGLKALPPGGGGGKQTTRELFDTLLLWKGRVPLDKEGNAVVEIPLNDSLTGFRIAAIATAGAKFFGTGQAGIRTSQDIMLLSGLPPMVREGDRFRAGFTVRNASDRSLQVEIAAVVNDGKAANNLSPLTENLAAGEAKEVGWEVKAPMAAETLTWNVTAKEKDGSEKDSLSVKQRIAAAAPVKVMQATVAQLDRSFSMKVKQPDDALPGKGGIHVSLSPSLLKGLDGVTDYMKRYPYTCMEQRVSRAVALRDKSLWQGIVNDLPSYLDGDGLVKYFPRMSEGSEALTSYILSVTHEAGLMLPREVSDRMAAGLTAFIDGRVSRRYAYLVADLSIRKLRATETLSRIGKAEPRHLDSISIEPNLWPTSAVLDWINILGRLTDIPDRDKKMREAEQIVRSRLNFQGTVMGFSTEKADTLWWLMVSPDENAVRSVLTFLDFQGWKEDMPRLILGALGRQSHGRWDTTVANAWGTLAMEKFAKRFETTAVSGVSGARIDDKVQEVSWTRSPEGKGLMFGWPTMERELAVTHQGSGKPWVAVQSLASVPLKKSFSSGYTIKKALTPVEQKQKGKWSTGDVIRVRLDLEAQADMTWVAVNDPVPAGASILGIGLGRDSAILTSDEQKSCRCLPVFEERSFEAFRAYYDYVPKGKWSVEYTLRLNNEGTFALPETRVEALYAPEMFGEAPNNRVEIVP